MRRLGTARLSARLSALAGGQYKTTLVGEEFLLVEGQLEIDIFSDQFVTIPLALMAMVLAALSSDPYARGYEMDLLEQLKSNGQGCELVIVCDRATDKLRKLTGEII